MPDYLETTVDKFTLRVPTDRLYSREGAWVLLVPAEAGERVRVGLTDFVQLHGGDATFVTVKPPGTRLRIGDDLADFETIKTTIVLASPVSGTIVAVNDALEPSPELVNQSPYEKGWLAEIEAADWGAERAALLDASAYFVGMKAEAEEEVKSL